jgi:c-di-GMP-binding flagellar brake protein YcgR
MSKAMSPDLSLLAVNSPVMVRVAHQHDREFSSRIEDLDRDAVIVAAPPGANSAVLASGTREVELSWLSPRGRYEQSCRVEPIAGRAGTKRWRLRPLRQPILVQRRRYIRVRANIDIAIDMDGDRLPGATVDISEGGFRVRVPRRDVPPLHHTVIHATIAGTTVHLPGYVVRSTDVEPDQTEAVIAFQADGSDAEAVRKLVLHLQLRARASRHS